MPLCMCLYTYIIILIKVIISMVEETDILDNCKYHICSEKEMSSDIYYQMEETVSILKTIVKNKNRNNPPF